MFLTDSRIFPFYGSLPIAQNRKGMLENEDWDSSRMASIVWRRVEFLRLSCIVLGPLKLKLLFSYFYDVQDLHCTDL